MKKEKTKAPRNRTLTVSGAEYDYYSEKLHRPEDGFASLSMIQDKTILGDMSDIIKEIPDCIFDLIVLDPPYNLSKDFNGMLFKKTDDKSYTDYLSSWFEEIVRTLKPSGSLYLCGDWRSTAALYNVMASNMIVRNRITWQREKGRGAKSNWKNAMEDIWFGTKHKTKFYFDVEAVKMKRRVIAPYKKNGKPKDWEETESGNFRLTYPSNFWDDISVPYWSMPENTNHPTQKPEKLIAKLILASCPEKGVVFDPFLGSGTTSVVAKKLDRHYVGIEINKDYCVWAEKRLANVDDNKDIQGYTNGVFWERNTLAQQKKVKVKQTIIQPKLL